MSVVLLFFSSKDKFFTKPIVRYFIAPLLIALTSIITHYIDSYRAVQSMSERFDIISEKMSYEFALDELTEYVVGLEYDKESYILQVEEKEKNIDSKQKDIDSKQKEIDQLKKEIDKLKKEKDDSDKITRAESYAGEGQYELAIPILASIENKSDEVNALLKNYTSIYERDVLSEAEALADDGDYEEAKTIIDEALKVVPNSKVLSEERKRIEPKYLNKVANVARAENIYILGDKDSVTIFGKKYNQGFKSHNKDFAGQFLNSSYSSNITYSLDGNYKQLSGIVGHIDFSGEGTPGEGDAGRVYNASVKIWGTTKDEETIELGSYELSPDDSFYEFKNISVENIDKLEFDIECGGNSEVGVVDLRIR